jgi:hypothetical protein
MMKPLPVDRSWRTKEPSGVEIWIKRPLEVSRYELEKLRSKNFKIPREPWLRVGGGGRNRSDKREAVAGDVTGR